MLKTSEPSLEAYHFEHRLWANEIDFFADELKIYEHRLEGLVKKHTDKEMLSRLEQFQNQFIRQKEVIDALRHDIHVQEEKFREAIQKKQELPMDEEYHTYLCEQMDSFRAIYGDLKNKFYRFMAKWK